MRAAATSRARTESTIAAGRRFDELRSQKHVYDEGWVHSVLADIFLSQRKLDDARTAIQRATGLTDKSTNRRTRMEVDITAARVLAASGKLADAERKLHAAIDEAKQIHLLERELESRLTLGEVEILSGKGAAGRARLAAVQKDAAAKGFGLLARKAAGPHPSF